MDRLDITTQHKDRLYTAIAVTALLIIIGTAIYFSSYRSANITSLALKPQGTLYFSLAEKNDNAFDIYAYNVALGDMQKTIETYDGQTNNVFRYTADVFGGNMVYAAALLDRESDNVFPHSNILQILVKKLGSPEATGSIFITAAPHSSKRLPKWSPDGTKVAYTARISSDSGFTTSSDSGVYVVVAEGNKDFSKVKRNEEFIEEGTYPMWSPDGTRLLFLKDDGLYFKKLDGEESTKVLSAVGGISNTSVKLDLSDQGDLLAWASPEHPSLSLYRITSWEPFTIGEVERFQNGAKSPTWPVFSPDGQYLAYVEYDWDALNRIRTSPRLMIYDLKSKQSDVFLNFDAYNPELVVLTEWQ